MFSSSADESNCDPRFYEYKTAFTACENFQNEINILNNNYNPWVLVFLKAGA